MDLRQFNRISSQYSVVIKKHYDAAVDDYIIRFSDKKQTIYINHSHNEPDKTVFYCRDTSDKPLMLIVYKILCSLTGRQYSINVKRTYVLPVKLVVDIYNHSSGYGVSPHCVFDMSLYNYMLDLVYEKFESKIVKSYGVLDEIIKTVLIPEFDIPTKKRDDVKSALNNILDFKFIKDVADATIEAKLREEKVQIKKDKRAAKVKKVTYEPSSYADILKAAKPEPIDIWEPEPLWDADLADIADAADAADIADAAETEAEMTEFIPYSEMAKCDKEAVIGVVTPYEILTKGMTIYYVHFGKTRQSIVSCGEYSIYDKPVANPLFTSFNILYSLQFIIGETVRGKHISKLKGLQVYSIPSLLYIVVAYLQYCQTMMATVDMNPLFLPLNITVFKKYVKHITCHPARENQRCKLTYNYNIKDIGIGLTDYFVEDIELHKIIDKTPPGYSPMDGIIYGYKD